MHPDVRLSVLLDAICGRNEWTKDPGPVVDELRAAADDRVDVLHESVGTWVGYFDSEHTHTLCVGLLEAFPEAVPFVEVGRRRRGRLHSTTGF